MAPNPRRFSFDTGAIWALIAAGGLATVSFIPSQVIPFIYTKITIAALAALVALVFFILARLRRGNVIVPPLALLGATWIVPAAYMLSALFSGVGISRAFFGTDMETDTLGFIVLSASLTTLVALVPPKPALPCVLPCGSSCARCRAFVTGHLYSAWEGGT